MIVDTTTWPVRNENEVTFEEHMSFLVRDWERYQAMQDGTHSDEDVFLARLELQSEFYLTMRQFLKNNEIDMSINLDILNRIMNKVGAEDCEHLEKKVDKLIMKNKIIEEAE